MVMEFKEMLLKNLYDNDFCYIGRDYNGELFAYRLEPFKYDKKWGNCGVNDFLALNEFNDLFPEIKWEDDEPFEYVDWTKVPVNTGVYVSNKSITDIESKNVFKRHFAYYRNGSESPFQVFENGTTSFTVRREGNEPATSGWKYCKLAENEE